MLSITPTTNQSEIVSEIFRLENVLGSLDLTCRMYPYDLTNREEVLSLIENDMFYMRNNIEILRRYI